MTTFATSTRREKYTTLAPNIKCLDYVLNIKYLVRYVYKLFWILSKIFRGVTEAVLRRTKNVKNAPLIDKMLSNKKKIF